HADDGSLHHCYDLMLLFGLRRSVEDAGACTDGGQRIAQIVAKHRDELLAQLRCLVLTLKSFLGRLLGGFRDLSGSEKLLLVTSSVGRPDERQANRYRLADRIPAFARVC